jgi:hypothetical protein
MILVDYRVHFNFIYLKIFQMTKVTKVSRSISFTQHGSYSVTVKFRKSIWTASKNYWENWSVNSEETLTNYEKCKHAKKSTFWSVKLTVFLVCELSVFCSSSQKYRNHNCKQLEECVRQVLAPKSTTPSIFASIKSRHILHVCELCQPCT